MRAWYMKNMSVGLLYNCSLGDLRPDALVALLQNRRHEGVDFMEVVPMEHQLPAQRDQVSRVCACRCVVGISTYMTYEMACVCLCLYIHILK